MREKKKERKEGDELERKERKKNGNEEGMYWAGRK
jgi:hypothetical protein